MTISPAARAAHSVAQGARGEAYHGWLQGRHTATFDTFRAENVVAFDEGWAELRRIRWSRRQEAIWSTGERCYFLSLVLDGPLEEERRNVALAQVARYGGKRVSLVPPNQTLHSVSGTDGELRVLRCFIDAGFVESICADRPTDAERTQLGAVDFSGSAIEWLLLRMHREIGKGETGMEIAVESIAREIAVEIARALERGRAKPHHSGGLASWQMRLLLKRVHADGPMPRLTELAEICGMTVRHLGRAFQADTGQTLGKFIAAAMAERAGGMLETGLPVGAVAAMLGYASSSSFAHDFHRETGLLPSGYAARPGLRTGKTRGHDAGG